MANDMIVKTRSRSASQIPCEESLTVQRGRQLIAEQNRIRRASFLSREIGRLLGLRSDGVGVGRFARRSVDQLDRSRSCLARSLFPGRRSYLQGCLFGYRPHLRHISDFTVDRLNRVDRVDRRERRNVMG